MVDWGSSSNRTVKPAERTSISFVPRARRTSATWPLVEQARQPAARTRRLSRAGDLAGKINPGVDTCSSAWVARRW